MEIKNEEALGKPCGHECDVWKLEGAVGRREGGFKLDHPLKIFKPEIKNFFRVKPNEE